jgi:prolyl oligopeptidase
MRKFEQQTALRFVSDTDEEILNLSLEEIISTSENALFVTVKDADGWTKVVRIAIEQSPSGKLKLGRHQTLNLRKGNLGPAFSNGKQTLLTFSLAASRWAILMSEIGEIDRTIKLPNHSTVTDCKFLKSKKLKLSFTSPIVKTESFIYDLQTERFADSDEAIEAKMLTDKKGHRYKTRYVEVESADKKKFPVRIIHRDDLDLDGKRPTLVEGYGGFDLAGYINPQFRFEISRFLADGGVHVAPALRGGNEMGPAWRKDAMFKHGTKMHTFNDMAATLRMLTAAKYSSPATIAIEGWSNGGYLVGAMITLFPDLFGLAIPGNGVHDQLRKQVLDPRFQGWEGEWGNPETDTKAFVQLAKISPASLALRKQNYPATLVIAGEDDSRVNRAHSLKLAAALQNSQKNPDNPVLLLAVPKSGHWVTKENLQDTLAYETQAYKWAMIYRRLGINPIR